jgi:hypothetical protein
VRIVQQVKLYVVTNVGDFADVKCIVLLFEVFLQLSPSFKHEQFLLSLTSTQVILLITLTVPTNCAAYRCISVGTQLRRALRSTVRLIYLAYIRLNFFHLL